jgi:nucleoside-diphosphate-sugar epimerase
MHVFLAGATGVLGRRIVPALISAGHEVTGLSRDPASAAALREAGARPVIADARDVDAMVQVMRDASPDVLMNQLTDLSNGAGPANAELRRASSAALAAGIEAAGVRRVVAQSISWTYAPGHAPAQEAEPLDLDAEAPRAATVAGAVAVEDCAALAREWVVLRYGMLYGPDTWFATDGDRADDARAGRLVPDADVTSFVHVDDAARAAVAALTWPTGAVNVCDDEPAAGSEWVPVFCSSVGAPAPAEGAARERTPWARGADNTWLRSGLAFDLRFPSWRTGFFGRRGDHDS